VRLSDHMNKKTEAIRNIALLTGFSGLLVGIGYAFSPDYSRRELENNYSYCSELVENAKSASNPAITNFVFDQVKIQEGYHAGKTCRHIIEEYEHRK